MFPYPIGSVLWLPAAVALLKDQLTIQEQFCYTLSSGLQLEEFQASLQAPQAENCGSSISVRIPADMIALFSVPQKNTRQTFTRSADILRRFPQSAFSVAQEDGQPVLPEYWQADIRQFQFDPDFTGSTLTVRLQFTLQVCGIRHQLLKLENLLPLQPEKTVSVPPEDDTTQLLRKLQQELASCQSELRQLKKQLSSISVPEPEKTSAGKRSRHYRPFPT